MGNRILRNAALATAALLALAAPAAAQIGFGGDMVRAADAFGGTTGVGARVRLGVPLFPLSAAVNADWFFPDCPNTSCSLRGATLDVNYSFPIPLLHPWVGVGWSIRRIEVGSAKSTERGLNAGVGAELQLTKLRPFADVRYEFVDAPEKQYVFRIGLMFN
jgi:hypothetical protein